MYVPTTYSQQTKRLWECHFFKKIHKNEFNLCDKWCHSTKNKFEKKFYKLKAGIAILTEKIMLFKQMIFFFAFFVWHIQIKMSKEKSMAK